MAALQSDAGGSVAYYIHTHTFVHRTTRCSYYDCAENLCSRVGVCVHTSDQQQVPALFMVKHSLPLESEEGLQGQAYFLLCVLGPASVLF